MSTLATPKKPAREDWHKADIKAAIEKAGYSLRRLSITNGMNPTYIKAALERPLPRAESIIAKLIGRKPHQIWPSRYDADGKPKRGLYRKSRSNGRDYLTRTSVRSGHHAGNGNARRGK